MLSAAFERLCGPGARCVFPGLCAVLPFLVTVGAAAGQGASRTVGGGEPGLEFDFPGMRIGVAEYDDGPTGTTVFYFPDGVKAAADVRGGAPGTLNVPTVGLAYEALKMHAVVFSGGSRYGLSAATGVANEIKDAKAEEGEIDFIARVLGAIIYDVGGRRFSRVTPDDRLGRAALRSAEPGWYPLGARGAGRLAMQGSYYLKGDDADAHAAWAHSGQGGAFRTIGASKIGVFTVVNALGTIVDRDGRVVRCRRNSSEKACPTVSATLAGPRFQRSSDGSPDTTRGPTANTTLTLVVTNQKLPFWALQRLAVQVHTSMGRAIQPFATEKDGDVLYAVTTDVVENPTLSPMELGVLASELAWDAVLSSVPDLPPAPALLNSKLSPDQLRQYTGTFEFAGGGELSVVAEPRGLVARFSGNGRIYFDHGRRYELIPAEGGQFVMDTPARDVIRFDRADGRVASLTLNPGPWSMGARRRR